MSSMKKSLLAVSLVAVLSAATTTFVLPSATAQSGAQSPADAAASVSSTPEAPLVTGLPDFTRLVERVAPAVVSIESTIGARQSRGQQMPDDAQIPEIFRRFFGPGFEMPGGPRGPGGNAPRGRSMGTGFIISADGYLLTNHHVVDGADEVTVRLSDRREFAAEVVGSDAESDVAVLKIDAAGLPTLRFGNGASVKPGQWAVAIGSPFGFEQSVTAGIVSAVQRSNQYADQRYVPFIQTDVPINQGNSGGPLLNVAGEVIGINSQIFSNSGGYMGVSFAIPIDLAANVAEQIKDTGSVQRGQVGVEFQATSITADQAKGLDLPDTRGALVNTVLPGGPAARAGIEPGDVIRSVDGRDIVQPAELPPLIGSKAPGTKVKLGVYREGRVRNIDVTLDQLAGAQSASTPRGDRSDGQPAAASANPLGLVGRDLDAAQRRQYGLGADEGVLVASAGRGAAANAGIAPGDVILRVGRTPVGTVAALDRALQSVSPGDTVMLLVRGRGGATQYRAVSVPETAER